MLMEKLATPEFWQSQWTFVMNAPWLIVPLLVVVAFVVWRVRGAIDNGEVRGLRAKNELLDAQLVAAKDSQPLLSDQLAVLKAEVTELKAQIHAQAAPEVLEGLATAVASTATAASDTGADIARVLRAEPGYFYIGPKGVRQVPKSFIGDD
jgi:hypothetical protein